MSSDHTVPSTPPPAPRPQVRGSWPSILEEARQRPGEWRRLVKPMTRGTASQLASDLRRSHERDTNKLRVTGMLAGDRWEARWGQDSEDPEPQHFYVWLRWAPLSDPRPVESAW